MANPTLYDMARMTTGTIGTGTITLGSAVQSFLTFGQAGVPDQGVVRYLVEDPPNREVGSGTYTASGTTLTRTVLFSTNSNAAISLSGVAQVALTALAEDIVNKGGDTMVGALNWATAPTLASAATVNIGAAASNYIIISGTTAITAFDTIAQGAERTLRFQASLTLTNGTAIICLGSANVQTAAGDIADFVSEGSGNWRMLRYIRGSGAPFSAIAPTVDIRTASATITIPTGATKLKITLVGAGGGGGGCGTHGSIGCPCPVNTLSTGGSGGPAAALVKVLTGLTPGNTLALTVGAGGGGGSAPSGNGSAGGDTKLASGSQSITTLTAGGGGGGGGAANASSSNVTGSTGSSGAATNGDLNIPPIGTTTALALGGPALPVTDAAGNTGQGYGGGGGGGNSLNNVGTHAGGAGAGGFAILEWYA